MLTLQQATNIDEADVMILTEGLNTDARLKKNMQDVELFAFFLRDEQQQIKGGCNGFMYYGCIYVDQLWIESQYRGQDYGSVLMKAAEDLGRSKGCLFSTVETMDWQGLDFYKKLGYHVESEQRGYFNNSVMYSLRKDF